MRDAATDPRPGDFCPPLHLDPDHPSVDPHGRNVASAEVDSPIYDQMVAAVREARGETGPVAPW